MLTQCLHTKEYKKEICVAAAGRSGSIKINMGELSGQERENPCPNSVTHNRLWIGPLDTNTRDDRHYGDDVYCS